jgi:hypothetical protein
MKSLEFHKSKYRDIINSMIKYFGFEGVRWWIHETNIYTEQQDGGMKNDKFSIFLDCTDEEYKKITLLLMSI